MQSKRKRKNTEDFINLPNESKLKLFENERCPLKSIQENAIFLNISQEYKEFPSFPYSSNLIKTRQESKRITKNRNGPLLDHLLEEEHNRISQYDKLPDTYEEKYKFWLAEMERVNNLVRTNSNTINENIEINAELNNFNEELKVQISEAKDNIKKMILIKNEIENKQYKELESWQRKIADLNINELKMQILKIKADNDMKVKHIEEQKQKENQILSDYTEQTRIDMNNKQMSQSVNACIHENEQRLNELNNLINSNTEESMKDYREIRFIKEQINIMTGKPRIIIAISPKDLSVKNFFDYENYFKIAKNNKMITLYQSEKITQNLNITTKTVDKYFFETTKFTTPLKDSSHPIASSLKRSESDSKFYKKGGVKLPPSPYSYKFDVILDCEIYSFFFFELARKLFFELEFYFKINLYRNLDNLVKGASYQHFWYEGFFGSEKGRKGGEKGREVEKYFFDNYWREGRRNGVLGQTNVIFFGDKRRGLIENFLRVFYEGLRNFENEKMKIQGIKFLIDSFSEQEEHLSFQEFTNFINFIQSNLASHIYTKFINFSICFEIYNKDITLSEIKKFNFISLNILDIDNQDMFVRQYSLLNENDKITSIKEKTIERLEPFIKGSGRSVLLAEIPFLIKLNRNSGRKFEKVKRILDLLSKLK